MHTPFLSQSIHYAYAFATHDTADYMGGTVAYQLGAGHKSEVVTLPRGKGFAVRVVSPHGNTLGYLPDLSVTMGTAA